MQLGARSILCLLFACPLVLGQTFQFRDMWPSHDLREFDGRALVARDFNRDGSIDILAVGDRGRTPRLFHNDGRGRFVDVTRTHMQVHNQQGQALVAADFNLDGHDDVIMVGLAGAWLLLGDRTGGFRVDGTGLLPSVTGCWSAGVGDMNRDGAPDVIITAWTNGLFKPRLFLNDGKGKFVEHKFKGDPVGHALAVGDVDGDTDLDLVLGHFSPTGPSHAVRLWLNGWSKGDNQGQIQFSDETQHLMPSEEKLQAFSLHLDDLDDDGDLDLVIGIIDGQDRLYVNRGGGRFDHASTALPRRRDNAVEIDVADLNADGHKDLVMATGTTGTKVLLYDPSTSSYALAGPPLFQGGRWPFEMSGGARVCDLDGDGLPDLLLGSTRRGESVRVYWSEGSSFRTRSVGPDFASARVAFGRLDRDLLPDIAIADLPAGQRSFPEFPSRVRLLDNVGYGELRDEGVPVLGPYSRHQHAHAVAFADLDGDGDDDLLLANRTTGENRYLRNDAGNLVDVSRTHLRPATGTTTCLLVADFNRDGKNDLFVGNSGAANARADAILWNEGSGRLVAAPGALPGFDDDTLAAAAFDYDKDGDLDLITCGSWGTASSRQSALRLLRYDANQSKFVSVAAPTLGDSLPTGVAVGDLNADGFPDFVVASTARSGTGGQTRLYLNDKKGGFVDATGMLPRDGTNTEGRVAVGDLDEDGDADLIVGRRLYRNVDNRRFEDQSARLAERLVTERIEDVALRDLDLDGDLDLYVAGWPSDSILYNLHRQLGTAVGAAQRIAGSRELLVGESYRWAFTAQPGYATADSFHFLYLGASELPMPMNLGLWGFWRIAPALGPLVIPVPRSGKTSFVQRRRLGRALAGLRFYMQSIVFDGARFRVANAIRLEVRDLPKAPRVVRVVPRDGAVDVEPTVGGKATPITVTFDEAMNESTVRTSVSVLVDGNPVDGDVTYDQATKTATFLAKEPLHLLGSYEVRVKPSAQSAAGVSLGMESSSTFLVRSGVWSTGKPFSKASGHFDVPSGDLPLLLATRTGGLAAIYRGPEGTMRANLYDRGNQAWSPPVTISSPLHTGRVLGPAAVADQDGNMLVVWVQGNTVLANQADSDFKWGKAHVVTSMVGLRNFYGLRPVILGAGRQFIAWVYLDTDGVRFVSYASRDARDPQFMWRSGRLPELDGTGSIFGYLGVALDAQQREIVAGDTKAGDLIVVYRDRSTSPTWKRAKLGVGSQPSMSALADKRVLVLWKGFRNRVFANYLDSANGVGVGRDISQDVPYFLPMHVASGDRRVRIAWETRHNDNTIGQAVFHVTRPWSRAWDVPYSTSKRDLNCRWASVQAIAVRVTATKIGQRGWIQEEQCSGKNVWVQPIHPSKGERPRQKVGGGDKVSNVRVQVTPTGEGYLMWHDDRTPMISIYR